MVSKDRIVPIQKIDRISAFGEMLAVANVSTALVKASNPEGDFAITGSGSAGNKLCNEPARSIELANGITGITVYFVSGAEFKGITKNGSAVTLASASLAYADLACDGVTMYKAVLSSGEVTISAITPQVA